ncbi:MAG: hypothetical protein B7733_14660, partial [Myxococcales bacterium FL481]
CAGGDDSGGADSGGDDSGGDDSGGNGGDPPPAASSCANYGCQYGASQACQCDGSCPDYGDCCEDFESVCG